MLSNLQLFLLALVLSIFNWLMTFLGSSLVYFVKSKSQKLVSIALGLAAGIMIAATFFSLLLPAPAAPVQVLRVLRPCVAVNIGLIS